MRHSVLALQAYIKYLLSVCVCDLNAGKCNRMTSNLNGITLAYASENELDIHDYT